MMLNSEQKKALTAEVILGVLCLFVIGYFWVLFGKAAMKKNEEQIVELRAEKQAVEARLQEIEEFKKIKAEQWDDIQATLEKLSRRLPSTSEAPVFYNAVQESLQMSGVAATLIDPMEVKVYQDYSEIPYAVETTGRYHDFGLFINLIEQNERFMRIKTFKMENEIQNPSRHPIAVNIATYKLEN